MKINFVILKIFRHGMRYPKDIELYPKDPYLHSFPKHLYTQLTEAGKKNSYALGQILYERYNKLTGTSYNKEIVQTISTATDRTVMTAQLVLAGLFQNPLNAMLEETFNWSQLPYQIKQESLDINVYSSNLNCTAYSNEYQRVINSTDYIKTTESYKNFFKILSNHTGVNVKTFMDVNNIYHALNAEQFMNLSLPEWTTTIYPNKIHAAAATFLEYINYNNVLRRLNGGQVLSIIIRNLLNYISNDQNQKQTKLYLLSGHDRTVASVLAALDLFIPHIPKYNSALIFELHQVNTTKQYVIKMFYLKDVNQGLEQLLVKECPSLCTVQDFIEALKSNTMTNHEDECENRKPTLNKR
ncbi:hypothetical protein RN001_004556 [Aquatica leii]|uniref:acid phosphatase n=1 Tax=Aquatica leii TaxID=1421715 RepID=A0AAN7SHI3_9COLE|nr:hypothetical protein RN001_004556 [Aquatica leii]